MEIGIFSPDQLLSISKTGLLNQVKMCLNFFIRWINQGIEVQHAQFSSLKRNPLSEIPEPEIFYGSVGHLQRNQSSDSQGLVITSPSFSAIAFAKPFLGFSELLTVS